MPSTRSLAISALLATAALAAPARETERDTNRPAPTPAPTTIIRPKWTQEDVDRWMSALIVGYAGVEIETFPSEPTKTIMHEAGVARTVAPDLTIPTGMPGLPDVCLLMPPHPACQLGISDAGIEIETFPSEPTKMVMHKAGVARTVAPDLVPTGEPGLPDVCWLTPFYPGCQPEIPDPELTSMLSKIHYPTPTTLQTTTKPTKQADVTTKRDEAPEPTETSTLRWWWPFHEYDRCDIGGPFDPECDKHFKHLMETLKPILQSKASATTAPTVTADAKPLKRSGGTITIPYEPTITVPYEPTSTADWEGTVTVPYEPTSTADNWPGTYTVPYKATSAADYTGDWPGTYTVPYKPTSTK